MSRLTLDDVRRVAELAALELDDAAAADMCAQLGSVLEYMEALDRADVAGVPPTFHPIPETGHLREDAVVPSLPREEALAAAPESEAGGFAVPRVLEGDS